MRVQSPQVIKITGEAQFKGPEKKFHHINGVKYAKIRLLGSFFSIKKSNRLH